MKTKLLIVAVLFFSLFTQSCQKEDIDTPTEESVLPSRFKVDIPSSISNYSSLKSGSILKSAKGDTIKGDSIYQNLRTFVAIGEGASDIVQELITSIAVYRINKPMTVSFESEDDHRVKNLIVKENVNFNGRAWKYMLTIYDAASLANPDSGKAIQIFWNTSPIEGISILKPYNINRTKDSSMPDAMFRIEYSEVADQSYDSHMIVDIAGLPLADPKVEPYSIKSLSMFVGKKGDIIDVYGNSNHPNARFFTEDQGFDWAFVASANENKNISVAEVGLPPCNLASTSRQVLLNDYSIKKVLTDQINEWFMQIFGLRPNSNDLASYLKNADAPGFFTHRGFVQAGTAPNTDYDPLISRIANLTPYSPKAVSELTINFK